MPRIPMAARGGQHVLERHGMRSSDGALHIRHDGCYAAILRHLNRVVFRDRRKAGLAKLDRDRALLLGRVRQGQCNLSAGLLQHDRRRIFGGDRTDRPRDPEVGCGHAEPFLLDGLQLGRIAHDFDLRIAAVRCRGGGVFAGEQDIGITRVRGFRSMFERQAEVITSDRRFGLAAVDLAP